MYWKVKMMTSILKQNLNNNLNYCGIDDILILQHSTHRTTRALLRAYLGQL
jgi:hypothetical protein